MGLGEPVGDLGKKGTKSSRDYCRSGRIEQIMVDGIEGPSAMMLQMLKAHPVGIEKGNP